MADQWVQDPGERCNRLGIEGAGRDLVVGERDHAVVGIAGRFLVAEKLRKNFSFCCEVGVP